MVPKSPINILFGATSDYLSYATVTARSVAACANGRPVVVHFMYADIVKPISDEQRRQYFELAKYSFEGLDVTFNFYDLSDKVHLLDGQNTGCWGPEISMTHYLYLLAPVALPNDVERVIYMDTDMAANADLSPVYDTDIGDKLIMMTTPVGDSLYPDMSNSGFLMLNLKQWRHENTLDDLLTFGRNLPKCFLCDQHLLYQYFTKQNPQRVGLVDVRYNSYPHNKNYNDVSELKVVHYCGGGRPKPWQTTPCHDRCYFVWWKHARHTAFYEMFLLDIVNENIHNATKTCRRKHHSFWWHLRHMKF